MSNSDLKGEKDFINDLCNLSLREIFGNLKKPIDIDPASTDIIGAGGDELELMRINDVVDSFGISSRTLRYYEQMGILWSSHPDNRLQRYYDSAALERLKQILVLRKLQIPIKDIAAVFKSENTAALIQAFVDKLESLDNEITALSELRRVVDEFLREMLVSGIKKISAITLLYEETEKRLVSAKENEPLSYEKLSEVSREALRLHDVRIIRLPPMRVLTSRLQTGQIVWQDGMENLFAGYGLMSNPGFRDCFFRKEASGEWVMLMKIPQGYDNATPYTDEAFPGGLFAVASASFEVMDDTFLLLRDWANKSSDFALDTGYEMIEEILPWDIVYRFNRYQQDVFVPIKLS